MHVERRIVERTGVAYLGWRIGNKCARETRTVKYEVWCLISENEIIAECRRRKNAEMLAKAFNHVGGF